MFDREIAIVDRYTMAKKKGRSPEDLAIMHRMGKMMRRRREEKKDMEKGLWTQPALGKRVGISSQMIGYIEAGKKWPGPSTLLKLSKELGLDIRDLLRRRDFQLSTDDGNSVKVSGE
jgi:transcriptional regulator with XRE-family HTH domain